MGSVWIPSCKGGKQICMQFYEVYDEAYADVRTAECQTKCVNEANLCDKSWNACSLSAVMPKIIC
jgi:hypothetical protein